MKQEKSNNFLIYFVILHCQIPEVGFISSTFLGSVMHALIRTSVRLYYNARLINALTLPVFWKTG
jgi:hypothetical protein